MATPPETFGFGARSSGTGGGGLAWSNNSTSAYLNPAGLSRVRSPEAGLGVIGGFERFQALPDVWWDTNRDGVINTLDTPLAVSSNVENTVGMHAYAGRNIGGKFGIGLALYVPAQRIIRFMAFEPSLPVYFMHVNRPQRYVLALGVGGEPIKGVHVGFSMDLVPKARSTLVATLAGSIQPPDGENETVSEIVVDVHEVGIDLRAGMSPVLGLQLDLGTWSDALQGLSLGATWRGAVGFPLDIEVDVQGNVGLEDIGELEPYITAAILKGNIQLFDHYVPMSVAFGFAYQFPAGHGFYLDATWKDWRPMTPAVASITDADLLFPLIDLSDTLQDGNSTAVVLRSTWSVRGGGELFFPKKIVSNRFEYVQVCLRFGAGYEQTPLVGQGSNTALLDTDRVLVALGAGVETQDPLQLLNGPIRFDLFSQFHGFPNRFLPHQSDTPEAGFPVEESGFPIGGFQFVAGAQWGFEY